MHVIITDERNIGNTEKSKVEYIDEEKKSIAYTCLEGRFTKAYKSFQEIITVKAAPTPENGCVVVLTCIYEKLYPFIPGPDSVKDILIQIFKGMDDYTLANYKN